jgi:hypothetical protein
MVVILASSNSSLQWRGQGAALLTSLISAAFSSVFSIWPTQPYDKESAASTTKGSGLKGALAMEDTIIDLNCKPQIVNSKFD